jgi:hypothetical protein
MHCIFLISMVSEQASVATEDGLAADDFNDDDTATYALSDATSTVSACHFLTNCMLHVCAFNHFYNSA